MEPGPINKSTKDFSMSTKKSKKEIVIRALRTTQGKDLDVFAFFVKGADIVKVADHVIDVGPEGGKNGGMIIAQGTPEEVVKKYAKKSFTAKYLAEELR